LAEEIRISRGKTITKKFLSEFRCINDAKLAVKLSKVYERYAKQRQYSTGHKAICT
jgi:hypothetical protein